MVEYEVRFFVDIEVERNLKTLITGENLKR